mgnify:CR=1 FL=1
MNKRNFAYYVMNQLEHRHHDGEAREMIIIWLNDFAQKQEEDSERYGDSSCSDNADVLRSMRDAYVSDGLKGCRKYLNEIL